MPETDSLKNFWQLGCHTFSTSADDHPWVTTTYQQLLNRRWVPQHSISPTAATCNEFLICTYYLVGGEILNREFFSMKKYYFQVQGSLFQIRSGVWNSKKTLKGREGRGFQSPKTVAWHQVPPQVREGWPLLRIRIMIKSSTNNNRTFNNNKYFNMK